MSFAIRLEYAAGSSGLFPASAGGTVSHLMSWISCLKIATKRAIHRLDLALAQQPQALGHRQLLLADSAVEHARATVVVMGRNYACAALHRRPRRKRHPHRVEERIVLGEIAHSERVLKVERAFVGASSSGAVGMDACASLASSPHAPICSTLSLRQIELSFASAKLSPSVRAVRRQKGTVRLVGSRRRADTQAALRGHCALDELMVEAHAQGDPLSTAPSASSAAGQWHREHATGIRSAGSHDAGGTR